MRSFLRAFKREYKKDYVNLSGNSIERGPLSDPFGGPLLSPICPGNKGISPITVLVYAKQFSNKTLFYNALNTVSSDDPFIRRLGMLAPRPKIG